MCNKESTVLYGLQFDSVLKILRIDIFTVEIFQYKILRLWGDENVSEYCNIDYILITNVMHQLLFIHKILFSSTCFEPQVLIFSRIQLYTCSIWYCHSVWDFLVACRYTTWVLTQAVYRQATKNSHREWQCHMLHVYDCILLKMSTWCSKHVEENSILWINNNWCIKLVINI